MRTRAFHEACNYSGNVRPDSFAPDDNADLIGLYFGGHYTVPEVAALLADLQRVQSAFEKWREWLRLRRAQQDRYNAGGPYTVVSHANSNHWLVRNVAGVAVSSHVTRAEAVAAARVRNTYASLPAVRS